MQEMFVTLLGRMSLAKTWTCDVLNVLDNLKWIFSIHFRSIGSIVIAGE